MYGQTANWPSYVSQVSSLCRPISADQARAIANRVQQIHVNDSISGNQTHVQIPTATACVALQRGAMYVDALKTDEGLSNDVREELEAAVRLGESSSDCRKKLPIFEAFRCEMCPRSGVLKPPVYD